MVKEILVDSKKKLCYKGLVVEDLVLNLIPKERLADKMWWGLKLKPILIY